MKRFIKTLAAIAATTIVFAACSNIMDDLKVRSASQPEPAPAPTPAPAPEQTPTPTPEQTNTQSTPVTLETPLTLEAAEAGAVVTFDNKAFGPVTYKVNGGEAQKIASGDSANITLAKVGDKVEFFGDNKAYATNNYSNYSNIACDKDCYVYGNIMSLVKSEHFEKATTLENAYTFAYLFKSNTHIKNKIGADLLLPATTLADGCYIGMFDDCKSLTAAPELKAATLANYCYANMFFGCASLTSAPSLPATTLAEGCYKSMFYKCTSLTSAPSLNATTLAIRCYQSMFEDCTSLASAPSLPATTLANHCYFCMFEGCASLTAAPSLPATTLADYCYSNMFNGCASLTAAPSLPATTLTVFCYDSMFDGCASLASVTCLATNISATGCTTNWLYGVAATGTFTKAANMNDWPTNSASGIPSGWTVENSPYTIPFTLEACDAGAVVTFDNQAKGPVNYKVNGGAEQTIASSTTGTITLSAIGDKVEFFADNKTYTPDGSSGGSRITISKDCYIYGNIMSLVKSKNFESARTLEEPRTFACLFLSNTHIKNKNGIDLLLPATTLTDDCYLYMFSHCSELTRAPALPATTLTAGCYTCMFEDCTNLTTAPDLPATTMKFACYSCMFSNCRSLTKAPDLPATVLAKYCYEEMFAACTSLTSAPNLPATTLEKECYYRMFFSCISLTSAPSLPATTLAEACYVGMFENCTKLSNVTCLATDISASGCTTDWLDGVAASGTFTKAKDVDWSGKTGKNGIPNGWTVVEQ